MKTLKKYLEEKYERDRVIFLSMPLEEAQVFQSLIESYKKYRKGLDDTPHKYTNELKIAREKHRYALDVFLFMTIKGPKEVRLKGDFLNGEDGPLKYMLYPVSKREKYLSVFKSEPNESYKNLWPQFIH